ncbi:MAG: hypothetical protein ABJC24_06695 [Chloroflexota bacterium]
MTDSPPARSICSGTGAPLRYVACHPGALVHQDHKKLGRVPDGGGWRVLGREHAPHHGHSHAGYDHLEVFIDDASRYAVVVPVDNGASYRSHAYRDTLAGFGIGTNPVRLAHVPCRVPR